MVITVKCRKDRNTDEIVNDIGGYEARCAAKTAAAQAKPASSPAPHGERPAWMRNIGTHEILELIKLQIAIGLRQAGISV